MKQIFILIAAIATLASCNKDTNMFGIDCSPSTTKAIQSETDSIGRYLDWRIANGADIKATLHPNGFYYEIITEGNSERPEICSTINVDYTGRRFGGPSLEGTVFDTGSGANLALYNLIAGWKQSLLLLGTGGKIHLYLPPSLAYGTAGSGAVKGNTFLFFEITLNSFI